MTNTENPTCLDAHAGDTSECSGAVLYRMAMSPTGIEYPRCDRHMESRWETQQEISNRYGVPLTYYGNDRDGYDDDWDNY